jgi:alpha-beta hydrolase superfamily lysophospholipase
MQNELTHRTVTLNGLQFHIAEQGQGPLVLLCHGWPECWYSWRHQLRALAEAGFHAVAPDMRGFALHVVSNVFLGQPRWRLFRYAGFAQEALPLYRSQEVHYSSVYFGRPLLLSATPGVWKYCQ